MLCVFFDGLHQSQLNNIILCLFLPLWSRQHFGLLCLCLPLRSSYLRDIVEFDKNLVNLAIGELAHHLLVFMIWLFAICIILTAALFFLIVVVHEVVLVVEIIFANIDVAKGVCNSVSRRGFEILQERLESSW